MITTLALSLTMLTTWQTPPTLSVAVQNPSPANIARDFTLTKEVKAATMDNLIKEMNSLYVLPDVASKIEKSIREWMSSSDYEDMSNPKAFATKVNEVIKKDVTDAHLRFRYSENVLPEREDPREASKAEIKKAVAETRFVNSGFEKVERLIGNVGYISFVGFWGPEDMARPLEGAMRFLANVDAVIVDLRKNGGGDPSGVQLFCSYFFDPKPVHLNDITFREGNKTTTTEYWTLKKVAGPRLPKVPLYVLTSKRTGSGAEECAYDFQQVHRGTLIGESTWGGANPGGVVRLGDHFQCFIPVGMARNPYTKTNWEGAGVQPDIQCPAAEALKTAHILAVKKMINETTDQERKDDLSGILKSIVSGS